ncbi:SUKH-4 family immunity protein [Streptomyces shaanxiensis]|uniref:SUKH-4 immunity protein of toxin-antitoxin system n=1 Tax=Streptomyces shaanxiensis TaxID=653357 RepID=A0ABP7VWR9_9ACTN
MPQLADRMMMQSVFPAERLVTLDERKLPAELGESTRSLLTDVGLPDDRSSFFVLDGGLFDGETPNKFRRCAELRFFSRYQEMPIDWENWLVLGEIFADVVALDPVSGAVYCLPDGEYRACPLNQNLDSFLYFLYLLELERPNYDFSVSDEIPDSEGVAASLRERMIRVDPLPFAGVEPSWSDEFDWEAEDAPRMPTWDVVLSNVYESIG